MRIAIVDYGMGNLRSVTSALKYLGIEDIILSDNECELSSADKIILPGVGSFSTAMELIKSKKLDLIINNLAINKKKPVLGICLGMQLLGLSSDEGGYTEGLGLVDGAVDSFNSSQVVVPHIGYNQVLVGKSNRLYNNMKDILDFYFVHSFKMTSDTDIGQNMCQYNENFIASFEIDNIAGTQYHPELSQTNGLHVIKNFLELF